MKKLISLLVLCVTLLSVSIAFADVPDPSGRPRPRRWPQNGIVYRVNPNYNLQIIPVLFERTGETTYRLAFDCIYPVPGNLFVEIKDIQADSVVASPSFKNIRLPVGSGSEAQQMYDNNKGAWGRFTAVFDTPPTKEFTTYNFNAKLVGTYATPHFGSKTLNKETNVAFTVKKIDDFNFEVIDVK